MIKLMNIMMLSCKRVTELVELKSSKRLSFVERIQFKFHTLFCAACNTYEKQSAIIEQQLTDKLKVETEKNDIKLSEEAKSKILEKIKKS